jgi:hypothetical protein
MTFSFSDDKEEFLGFLVLVHGQISFSAMYAKLFSIAAL